jgi:hypothetical protein
LLRSHLLASLIAKQRRLTGPTRVLLLSLKADHASVSVAASYRKTLAEPSHLEHCYLERFIAVMELTADTRCQRRMALDLHRRYVDLTESEHLKRVLLKRTPTP